MFYIKPPESSVSKSVKPVDIQAKVDSCTAADEQDARGICIYNIQQLAERMRLLEQNIEKQLLDNHANGFRCDTYPSAEDAESSVGG